MVEIDNAIKRVDPEKVYNVSEIMRDNVFPWIKAGNHLSYRNAIYEDLTGENLLKTKASGSGRGRDYKIKGANIIKYLKKKNHENNTT